MVQEIYGIEIHFIERMMKFCKHYHLTNEIFVFSSAKSKCKDSEVYVIQHVVELRGQAQDIIFCGFK